mmetsp:Transcript_43101/g.71654  ORF Transcript_43101/g.71654 Transcript_43101/m.71654 type:complete len:254 (-) Transcript_43101:231-992(-)
MNACQSGCSHCACREHQRWPHREPILIVLFGDSNDRKAVEILCGNRTEELNVFSTQIVVDSRIVSKTCRPAPNVTVINIFHFGLSLIHEHKNAWASACLSGNGQAALYTPRHNGREGRFVPNLWRSTEVATRILPLVLQRVSPSPKPTLLLLNPGSIWDATCSCGNVCGCRSALEPCTHEVLWEQYVRQGWSNDLKLLHYGLCSIATWCQRSNGYLHSAPRLARSAGPVRWATHGPGGLSVTCRSWTRFHPSR